MKPLFIIFAFCFVSTSASACPNLAGHYLLQGEDGVVRYTVRQKGCERVEIDRTSTYLGKTSAVEALRCFIALPRCVLSCGTALPQR